MFSWNYSAFIFFSVFFFVGHSLWCFFFSLFHCVCENEKNEKRRNNKDRVSAVLRWFRTIVYTFEMTCVSPHILNIADIQIQIKYITRACISYVSSHLSWFQLSLYMSGVCMYVCMCASFAFVFFSSHNFKYKCRNRSRPFVPLLILYVCLLKKSGLLCGRVIEHKKSSMENLVVSLFS